MSSPSAHAEPMLRPVRWGALPPSAAVPALDDSELLSALRVGDASACSLDTWPNTITARVIDQHIQRRRHERRMFDALDTQLIAGTRSTTRRLRKLTSRSIAHGVLAHLNAVDDREASLCDTELAHTLDCTQDEP